jgi:primosomal protein N' (replication factor Y)
MVPAPGVRVQLPFGRGTRLGICCELTHETQVPAVRLKPLAAVLDAEPVFDGGHLDFLRWCAKYYQHPIGEVLAASLPIGLREGKALPALDLPAWRPTALGLAVELAGLKRAPKQQQLLALLRHWPEGLDQVRMAAGLGEEAGAIQSRSAALQQLTAKGLVEPCRIEAVPETGHAVPGPALNTEQQEALAAIEEQSGFCCHLLHGITGSGKTEVYLEAARQVLAQGRQVLVLVPEIGLTPQITSRFAKHLGLEPLLLHSGLADGERALAWCRAAKGDAALLLGTRSAVLTPLPRLGLVIVDEEHDLSFKQQEGFRYSARDLALVRAKAADCPVILGSATPSLESLQRVQQGRYRLLTLTRRAGQAQLPHLGLVDIRKAPLESGLSRPLLNAMAQTLARGEQVLVFQNRRGYAPVLMCYDCGWIAQCSHCDARLNLHLAEQRLCCHHCGLIRRQPDICPECTGRRLNHQGVGTEQLEAFLGRYFAEYSLVRIDRDSTRRKGSLDAMLEGVRQGRHQLLLGTQMLAKGHDFPNVTLVAMVEVDQGLFGSDFRAAERMAQLILQVAGRAGRAGHPGQVLIQTSQPEHPLLQTLIHQGYSTFARMALAERQAAHLPPFSYQILLRAEASRPERVDAFMQQCLALGQALAQASSAVEFWGPVPALMERRAGRYRRQLLLQSPSRSRLQGFLGSWLAQIEALQPISGLRWSVDVDPQEML